MIDVDVGVLNDCIRLLYQRTFDRTKKTRRRKIPRHRAARTKKRAAVNVCEPCPYCHAWQADSPNREVPMRDPSLPRPPTPWTGFTACRTTLAQQAAIEKNIARQHLWMMDAIEHGRHRSLTNFATGLAYRGQRHGQQLRVLYVIDSHHLEIIRHMVSEGQQACMSRPAVRSLTQTKPSGRSDSNISFNAPFAIEGRHWMECGFYWKAVRKQRLAEPGDSVCRLSMPRSSRQQTGVADNRDSADVPWQGCPRVDC